MKKRINVLLLLLLVMTLFVSACGKKEQRDLQSNQEKNGGVDQKEALTTEAQQAQAAKEETGEPLTEEQLFKLSDLTGMEYSLAELTGKVVFINFWASKCGPCIAEMPEIQAVYEQYGKNEEDVIILGIVAPESGLTPDLESVEKVYQENQLSFPSLLDEDAFIHKAYRIQAFPTTFVVNKSGRIVVQRIGGMTAEMMNAAIEEALAS